MTRRGGFTVVELIITITIMAILLTLSVIGLRATQANGRDEERKTDTANIARSLEAIYPSMYNTLFNPTNNLPSIAGYPDASLLSTYLNDTYSSTPSGVTTQGAFSKADLQAPGVTSNTISLIMATNNNQSPTGVTPAPTIDTYVYQPIGTTSSPTALCTSGSICRKFNLYYKLETDGAIQMITSKNQ